MSVLPYVTEPFYSFAMFRRTSPELTGPGSLWDEAKSLFPLVGGQYREGNHLDWRFPTHGVKGEYRHLQREKDIIKWRSKQIVSLHMDEAHAFTDAQFWGMWSRCRAAKCKVRPFARLTTNPDPDCFIRPMIGWYIGADGFAIPERSGKIRWFIRVKDELVWANDAETLRRRYKREPTSFSYLQGYLDQNQILLANDPEYRARLESLTYVDRMQLLGGNWDIRASAGDYFQRGWFPEWRLPLAGNRMAQVRAWDMAATPVAGDQYKPTDATKTSEIHGKDPDWTRGVKVSRLRRGNPVEYVIEHVQSARDRPGSIERMVLDTARHDGPGCKVVIFQDPAQAGVAQAERYTRLLRREGFSVDVHPTNTERGKLLMAKTPSAKAQQGMIGYVPGDWMLECFNEAEAFPDGAHDDFVDALGGAFISLGVDDGMIEVPGRWNASVWTPDEVLEDEWEEDLNDGGHPLGGI